RAAAAPVHAGAPLGRAGAGPEGRARAPADHPERRRAERGRSAAGVPLPPALSLRPAALRRRGARARRRVARPPGGLPLLAGDRGRADGAALGRGGRRGVTGYILRRLAALVPALFFVSVVTFAITLLLPGDPALAYIGEANINDRAMYLAVRAELGLDQPIPVQYLKWLGRAVQGDFGRSIRTREPALEGLRARLPVTLELALLAMAISLVIAVPIGILSAVRPNSRLDLAGTVVAMGGIAVPDFWLGILLI